MKVRAIIASAAVTVALAAVQTVPADTAGWRTLADAHTSVMSRTELAAERVRSEHVIVFFTRSHRWMVAPRHASCWSHVPWSRLCDQARRQLLLHRMFYRLASARLNRIRAVLAAVRLRDLAGETGTYLGAVRYVERFFGPQPFLRDCPASEGGYGPFEMNSSGSGAGGWLQFLPGTFYGIIDEAIASARARGMLVPDSARSWYSPLGQALAGRQMIQDGREGEWVGPTC